MTNPTRIRRSLALGAASGLAAIAALLAAPSAYADTNDLTWYLDRTYREVIDVGTQGDSHGDLTVTNGTLSATRGGKAAGSYATSQITVSVTIPGGRQDRKTDIAFTTKDGVIYTTALVTANAGTPPTRTVAHAIIGGTGKYAGARGEMTLKPLSTTRYQAVFAFVD